MWKVVFMLAALCSVSSQGSESDGTPPIVQTHSGTVRGSFLTSRLKRKFYSFRAIRYAQPPVGPLRFKPPLEHTWDGIFDATEDGPLCPQQEFNNTSEDCLRINVYTPKLPKKGIDHPKLPVIVFLHDGAYYLYGGTWALRGPEYFLDHDIVLVTLNYRLGVLGFLSTGDAEAPGNNGLKDQVLALKWVQKNIELFGGDKDSVTLLGYSAGGWSICMHMVSPMTKGLFHKGILMSGADLGSVRPYPEDQLDIAKKQASMVGCPTDSSRNIVTCLRTKSAKEITDTFSGFQQIAQGPLIIVTPVVERDFGQERYLTDQPSTLVAQKKFQDIPLIIGRNKGEFGFLAYAVFFNQTAVKLINKDFEKYAPILFVYESDTPKSREVSRAIKKFYLHDQSINLLTLPGLADAFADSIIGFRAQSSIETFSKYSSKPLYYYEVTYLGGVSEINIPFTKIPLGVYHQDELIYILYDSMFHPMFDEKYPVEARTVAKLTTLLVNFATYGNPTPKRDELFNNVRWQQFNLETQKYLDIGWTLKMKDHMFKKRYDFWSSLYPSP